jgi:hypothetical protein
LGGKGLFVEERAHERGGDHDGHKYVGAEVASETAG